MVGCDKGRPIPVQGHVTDRKSWIEIDVIEVEERKNPGVCARLAQMSAQVGADKLTAKRAAGDAVGPFIEIAKDDARPLTFGRIQNLRRKFSNLMASLKKRCPQMYVEQVELFPGGQGHFCVQTPSRFSSRRG